MSESIEEFILSACPKCGVEQKDFDGFGVLHCEACGYCRHPARDLIGGMWVCGLCGDKRPETR